ncbi:MAG: ABC transporter permease [Myxococcota bacterium]
MWLRLVLGLPALTLAIMVTMPIAALAMGATLDDLQAAVTDGEVLSAVGLSLGCAMASVVLGLCLGVPAAYLLARRYVPGARLWQALLDLPVVIPHPIVGIGLLLVFGRNRLVGAALRDNFGITVVSAIPGIVIAMLVVSSPFIVRAAYEGFMAVPLAVERTARSLGAGELRVFRTIALPQALRHIRSGALMAWARAISEFGSVVILAYYPRTAPVLIWDRFSAYGLRSALAPALVLLCVCLTIFVLLQALDSRPALRRRS